MTLLLAIGRLALFSALILVSGPGGGASAEVRVALVIGNADYAHAGRLTNPANDAVDVASALAAVDFEVTRLQDTTYDALRRALADFADRSARADVSVVYFAGHGLEIGRQNYLLPVDARLRDADDVALEAMPLSLLRHAARPARRLSLVIVDACRNNPFLGNMTQANRSVPRGLARVDVRGQNELVAFAAAEGTLAEDGAGRNSPFAQALVAALGTPGLEIGKLFRTVRDDVLRTTGGRQEPAVYGSLSAEDFFLAGPEPQSAEASARTTRGIALSTTAAPAASDRALDLAFWTTIEKSSDPRDYQDYLKRFPKGTFAGLARRRIEALGGAAVPATPTAPLPERQAVAAPFSPTRDDVRDLQARLAILGFDPGGADGVYGQRTAAAIRRYQEGRGRASSGEITEELMRTLTALVPQARVAAYHADAAAEAAERRREAEARRQAERAAAREAAERAAAEARATPADPDPMPEPDAAPAPAPDAAETGNRTNLRFGAERQADQAAREAAMTPAERAALEEKKRICRIQSRRKGWVGGAQYLECRALGVY